MIFFVNMLMISHIFTVHTSLPTLFQIFPCFSFISVFIIFLFQFYFTITNLLLEIFVFINENHIVVHTTSFTDDGQIWCAMVDPRYNMLTRQISSGSVYSVVLWRQNKNNFCRFLDFGI